jgi:copper transport protein
MTTTPRARVAAVLVALVTGVTGVLWAHAKLVRSEPTSGSHLSKPPDVIVLEFSESVAPATSRVELVAPDSGRISLAVRGDTATNRKILLADVPVLTHSGEYRLHWRLIGPDGHPVNGQFSFWIDSVRAKVSIDSMVLPQTEASPQSLPLARNPAGQMVQFLWTLSLLVLLGAVTLSLLVVPRVLTAGSLDSKPRAKIDVHMRSWVTWSALSLLVLAIVRLTSQAAALSGSTGAIRISDVSGIVTGSRWGMGWLAFVLCTIAALTAVRVARRPWPLIAGACGGLAVTSAFLGHAAAIDLSALAMSLDAIHVGAAGAWGGGIIALTLVAMPAAFQQAAGRRVPTVRALLKAFTPVALTSATILLATGATQAWLQVPNLESLLGSNYGAALIRKLVAVALVAALGAWHWRFVQPSIDQNRSIVALRWSLALDVVFVIALIALTAILMGTAPPVVST